MSQPTLKSSSTPVFWGINVLRIGAGICLLYMHGINHTLAAWQSMWNHVTWNIPQILEQANIPYAEPVAVGAAAILIWTCVSWILGFAVRFSSALFLPLTIGGLFLANEASLSGTAEVSILYFFIALTLIINGAGFISLDSLFNLAKAPKTAPARKR